MHRIRTLVALTVLLGACTSQAAILTEGFDQVGGFFGTTGIGGNLPAIPGAPDWFVTNRSSPAGSSTWFTGAAATFAAHSGTGYVAANFNNTTGTNTISDWLLTPVISFNSGDEVTFWTRTVTSPAFADRLQLRLSTNGASTDVGLTNTTVGDFTNLLVDINPNLILSGPGSYPNVWTQYTATMPVSGTGRLGFRYFVTNGGPSGANSQYIGVDSLNVNAIPEPGTFGLVAIGAALTAFRRRRR